MTDLPGEDDDAAERAARVRSSPGARRALARLRAARDGALRERDGLCEVLRAVEADPDAPRLDVAWPIVLAALGLAGWKADPLCEPWARVDPATGRRRELFVRRFEGPEFKDRLAWRAARELAPAAGCLPVEFLARWVVASRAAAPAPAPAPSAG
mgnify:CR=1 FL=1